VSKNLEDIQNPKNIGIGEYINTKLGKTAVNMDFGLFPTGFFPSRCKQK